jgi:alkanesulfonate monooxygenase SsuD/methylene tetrahydromethanopterin reductase-like flavin-dependent oxidoreductase (luciferase family)
MNRTTVDLDGLPPQHSVVSEAENATRAYHAVRKVVREQGQVMSAALENNENLWNTNKRLRSDIALANSTAAQLERERNHYRGLLEAIPAEMQSRLLLLGENEAVKAENAELRKANAELREFMIRSVTPELDSDQRLAKIELIKKQAAELESTGLVPTPEELAERDRKLWGEAEPVEPLDTPGPIVQH